MRHLSSLILNIIILAIRFARPGGARSVMAENIVLRQQLIILQRRHKRAPKLNTYERVLFGTLAGFIPYRRLLATAILIKPATIIKFHKALVKRKYSTLFSKKSPSKPGPKGPEKAIIEAIVAMKVKNPRFGYLRIAMQLANVFGIDINKVVVRRVLAKHYKPSNKGSGPSWLSFLANTTDSLWSLDFFRVESIHLKSYWIMVVMDQCTRRIIGFAVNRGDISGNDLCRMFNNIRSGISPPKYLSTDNAQLFQFHQWQANLRILDIENLRSIPYTPISHPFIERLIQTIRQEFLDHLLIWNEMDLTRKLALFQEYYNSHQCHQCHHGIKTLTPEQQAFKQQNKVISITKYRWRKYCNNMFELPIAA